MPTIDLIAVPFDGYGRPGNQSRAAAVLRDAGIVGALATHPVVEADDLDLPAADEARGVRTSFVSQAALVAMVEQVGQRRQGSPAAVT